jgi:putative peptidyl-prolyl cis-trans isomerase
MKNLIKTVTILYILIAISLPLRSWEPYDRVIAIVNTRPITESDVVSRLDQLKKQKRIKRENLAYEKSRVLDTFIENVLVDETAAEESIIVSNKKIMGHVDNILMQYLSTRTKNREELDKLTKKISLRILDKLNGDLSKKDKKLERITSEFIAFVEKSRKTDFFMFTEEIRINITKQQLIQIAIGLSPPSKKEVKEWFNKNRKKLGVEINAKHILIIPKGKSLAAERKANKKIAGLLSRVRKGESFEKLAAKYSEDRASAVKGGSLGWVNIATLDPYFANAVYRMKQRGQISTVFKSNFGYHIVKYLGRRPVKLESVERMIIAKLYNERMIEQFKKWVIERKNKSAIKIFMKNYVKKG